jgi:hypothetical protein
MKVPAAFAKPSKVESSSSEPQCLVKMSAVGQRDFLVRDHGRIRMIAARHKRGWW